MSEKLEHSPENTQEDIKFFNELAEKYGLEQTPDELILTQGTKITHIPKWQSIPLKDGAHIDIEEFIEKLLVLH